MSAHREWKIAFYGDDFTGSTDAMDMLARAGIPTVLFFSLPGPEQLEAFPDAQAFGVAGITRSLGPREMEAALRPVFEFFRQIRPRHVHYKVCSTFDSSPGTGSIGSAIDLGAEYFPARYVPLLVGVPDLGRYCVFGNLYARLGTSLEGQVYRIDRHPSMSRHPVTPAEESDLRRVLDKQTVKKAALFDLFHCRLPLDQARHALEALLEAEQPEIVLFDGLAAADLDVPGELMEEAAEAVGTLFSVGSSAVEFALTRIWGTSGETRAREAARSGRPILVLSGSCSPVTTRQIQEALDQGFVDIPLDTAGALEGQAEQVVQETASMARQQLEAGRSVIIHTFTGPDDPRNEATRAAIQRSFPDKEEARLACPRVFGACLGNIAREVLSVNAADRLVIAGGDTSGYVAGSLGIEAITVSQSFVRGAPMCRIHAPGTELQGKEINFKGGQVGTPDYFIKATNHSLTSRPNES